MILNIFEHGYVAKSPAPLQFNTEGTCVVPKDVILLLVVPIFGPSFFIDAEVF